MKRVQLLTIVVAGRTSREAQAAAREWAAAEPHIALKRITRVRPATPARGNAPNPERWEVELAFVEVEEGLGL